MKKRSLLITLIIICCVMLFTSCKVVKKKIPGGQIEIGGNSGKIESGDSSINYGDNLKWPKEFMVNIPEPKGKITAVVKDDKTRQCTVTFSEMSKDDASDYVVKLKGLGYSGGLEISDADSITFSGAASNGSEISFLYNVTAKEGSIFYNPGSTDSNPNNTESNTNNESVDLTDITTWPKEFSKEVPELKGKIVNTSTSVNYVSASLEYVEKTDFEAYIKQLKESGFTIETDESTSTDTIDFSAYNTKGEWVRAYFKIDEGKTSVIIEMEKP